jgi:hypothetical protein
MLPIARKFFPAGASDAMDKGDHWRPVSEAPFDCDIELAVISYGDVHALVFPPSNCRRMGKAEGRQRIEARPTHWRHWKAS